MGPRSASSTATSEARAKRLRGAKFRFPRITVTGTENILTAAVLAEGETILENCALEPEVTDLVELLTKMGARIEGAGTSTLIVQGVDKLHGASHVVIPDRIEAGTFPGGWSHHGRKPAAHPLRTRITWPQPSNCSIAAEQKSTAKERAHCASEPEKQLVAANITTEEYPGFATDMQAQFMALATQAQGVSTIRETIFENRYLHASEMLRMGANIAIDGNLAVVTGPSPLSGAPVTASDLRASAGLVLAALVANNTTWIDRVYHIDRGYQQIGRRN